MNTKFDEAQSTNIEYLTGELILARQANEIMTENNRRLERLLIKTIQDLQECRCLLDEMKFQVGELATVALARVKKS
jgi:hypothetical protein